MIWLHQLETCPGSGVSQAVPEKHAALLGAGLVPLPRGAGIAVQVNPGSLIAGCCFSFVLALAPRRGFSLLLLSLFYLLWAQEWRGSPAQVLAAAQHPLHHMEGCRAVGQWWMCVRCSCLSYAKKFAHICLLDSQPRGLGLSCPLPVPPNS